MSQKSAMSSCTPSRLHFEIKRNITSIHLNSLMWGKSYFQSLYVYMHFSSTMSKSKGLMLDYSFSVKEIGCELTQVELHIVIYFWFLLATSITCKTGCVNTKAEPMRLRSLQHVQVRVMFEWCSYTAEDHFMIWLCLCSNSCPGWI